MSQFNHLICHVSINDKSYLLDATNPLRPFELLATADLNGIAFILDDENPSWTKINPSSTTSQVAYAEVELDNNLVNLEVKVDGYKALALRTILTDLEDEILIADEFLPNSSQYNFKGFDIEDAHREEKGITFKCEFNWHAADLLKDEIIYFKPILNNSINHNPFKSKERYFPVDYQYPSKNLFILNIKIPEGYNILELPESKIYKLPNKLGTFIYNIKVIGNLIQVSSSFSMNEALVPSGIYNNLQEFYDLIIAKHNEPIVFKKNN